MNRIFISIVFLLLISCNGLNKNTSDKSLTMDFKKGTFGYDLDFLKKYHKDLVVLGDDSTGAQIIILPAYQGRVMTSTAEGSEGASFGWLNHELIASEKFSEHFSAFGGEERIWLGPEGGQFSIYFKKGAEFKFDNWYVPKEIDTESFELISSSKTEAKFEKAIHLENYSSTKFDLMVSRTIHLMSGESIQKSIGVFPSSIKAVGFESDNVIKNTGQEKWSKQNGLLSIWILSMLNAADGTTIVLPYRKGDSSELGKIVTDDYFGKVPGDRLKVDNGIILLKADGNHRSKIGISPSRALPIAGSFDAKQNVLTIAEFSLHENVNDYVNSLWQIQKEPFKGDAVNAYNDGPIDGRQMGKFYEVESSSPAAALAPGEQIQHIHRTIHLKGSKEDLNTIALRLFGIGLDAMSL